MIPAKKFPPRMCPARERRVPNSNVFGNLDQRQCSYTAQCNVESPIVHQARVADVTQATLYDLSHDLRLTTLHLWVPPKWHSAHL